jgi:haloalkane dehalogenase
VIAAYEAPYVDAASKAGARAFPLILLVLWAEDDPVLRFSVGERVSAQLNFPPPRPIADASHFLQEDAGPEIGRIIADWLRS